MKSKILYLIMNISSKISLWAWRKLESDTRIDRYKKAKNKKVW